VLFRTNTQPRFLTEQLMGYNIPVRMKDHIPNIYEHWIARDILTYIRIAGGSRKRADFLQIMNRPKRYIGRDSLCSDPVSFDEWEKLYEEQPWIAERIERLGYDIQMLSRMSPYAAINYIRKGIGYDDYLKEYAEYRNINKDDLFDILEELQESARGYKSYGEWTEHIAEYTAEMKKLAAQRETTDNAVTLATLHSSKGLEFDTVFIIDVNEGIMPYKKAVLDKDIEEERRLFFVGMTRARKRLYLSSVSALRDESAEVSRFIGESQTAPNHPDCQTDPRPAVRQSGQQPPHTPRDRR
jgi:DNA helicase-2/ATP-dependent DNA helicase PcrA